MASNLFQLIANPVPLGDGAGAWLDISTIGELKTFVTSGVFDCDITIEGRVSTAAGFGTAPLVKFDRPAQNFTFEGALLSVRVVISNYRSGTPVIEVGGTT